MSKAEQALRELAYDLDAQRMSDDEYNDALATVRKALITPDEALTLSNLIVGTRLQPFYPELQKKLQAISEED